MIVLDLECEKSAEVLNLTSNLNLFNKKIEWILLGSSPNNSLYLIAEQNINIDAKVLFIVKGEQEFEYYDIFHVKCPALRRNGLMFVNSVGNYSEQRYIANRLKYDNPFSFANYSLHATVIRIAICVSL